MRETEDLCLDLIRITSVRSVITAFYIIFGALYVCSTIFENEMLLCIFKESRKNKKYLSKLETITKSEEKEHFSHLTKSE